MSNLAGGRPYSVSVGDPARRDRLRELLDAVVDADNSDVGDMARSSYASEFHFSREVRRLTGESPAALRRRIMLERAAWRLHRGESVSAVADDEGWSSAEVFSRVFRRTFGVPPSRAADIQFRLPAPNGLHFHPPGVAVAGQRRRRSRLEELHISQLMVAHDVADTTYLINQATQLSKEQWTEGHLTRAGDSRLGRSRAQHRRSARRHRLDEGSLVGHHRRPRLPQSRGHPTRVDIGPTTGRPSR